MSGMEALAVFGLVCNVMQVIHFSSQTVSLCKKAFRTGSPDPDLGRLVDDSAQVYQDLVNSLQSTGPLTVDDARVLQLAEKTRLAALDIQNEARRIISSSTAGDLLGSIVGGIKAKLRENKLDKMEKRLMTYQRLLESGSLSSICKKTDALNLQQDVRFNHIDETLRNFIRSYAQGKTGLESLIAKHGDSIEHTVRAETFKSQHTITSTMLAESSRTRQDMIDIFQGMTSAPPRWQQRQTLLQSLKFESMNDRAEQIGQPHEGTYQWVMRGIRPWLEDDSLIVTQNQDQAITTSDCPHETASLNLPWRCFPCWLDSTDTCNKLYWLQGKPGSGKSTLMKFLVSEKSIWTDLKVSESDPLIIKHFFWAAGNLLQKSLRGLLLVMLSQFLSTDEGFLDKVIDVFPQAKLKHVHGDWTLDELERVADTWLSQSRRPIFVFLDGLDEVDDDGVAQRSLLDFLITKLATISTVRVCVSSRPEPLFKRHLAQFPTLQLQHLTHIDMARYVRVHLLRARPDLDAKELQDLVEHLLGMADGVFLWVALTVKSLCRGFANGDTTTDITRRLRQMPRGLHSLYHDMWARLNDDANIYREEAALYIRMVLDWRDMCLSEPLRPFHCLVASQHSKIEPILDDYLSCSAEELDSLCAETARRIETRTAGLLEVDLRKPHAETVQIIHRSALEFLQSTAEGQEILRCDKRSSQERLETNFRSIIAIMHLRLSGRYVVGDVNDTFYLWIVMGKIHEAWGSGRITEDAVLELVASCKKYFDSDRSECLGFISTTLPALGFAGVGAHIGLPNLLFAMADCGKVAFPRMRLSTTYRFYLIVAALAAFSDGSRNEDKAKVVEILTKDDDFDDERTRPRNNCDAGTHGISANLLPEPRNQRHQLVLLLSILNNPGAWPSGKLPLPAALKYVALKCGSLVREKALVVLSRQRIGAVGDDATFGLYVSVFGSRLLNTRVSAEMNMWLVLEINIFSLVELVLHALTTGSNEDQSAERSPHILEELRNHTSVLAFHVPGQLANTCGLGDVRKLRLKKPAKEEDNELIKSSLAGIRRDATDDDGEALEAGYYKFPTLTDNLRELWPRSEDAMNKGALMEIMAENPPNKWAEECMAHPPAHMQYAE
ncbi:hypothetical protein V8F06_008217 [Rhypophila decipiens]